LGIYVWKLSGIRISIPTKEEYVNSKIVKLQNVNFHEVPQDIFGDCEANR